MKLLLWFLLKDSDDDCLVLFCEVMLLHKFGCFLLIRIKSVIFEGLSLF